MPPAVIHTRCYAKINLYLDVLDRRRDGLHNIETIFQSISLADDLEVRLQAEKVTLECYPHGICPMETNLAWRAATLLAPLKPDAGANLDLRKHIPVAAGLAGGSSDAAGALAALNRLWNLELTDAQLAGQAAQLGSDVPFCLTGGTVAATGRGDELDPLPSIDGVWFVLLHPAFELSTARVYQSPHLGRSETASCGKRTARFEEAVAALGRRDWLCAISNTMESVAFVMHPELAELKRALLETGARTAAMSGSGPTLYGVYDNEQRARQVAQQDWPCPVSVVRPVSCGIEVRSGLR